MHLQGISLHLSGAQLSDLYFNFEHPARSAVFARATNGGDDLDESELKQANLADAKEFAQILGIDDSEFVETLVKDFESRI